jgi:F0F1-type ATP synthase alpha subunit
MAEQIGNLSSEVERINNQRMQFDHRLSYLETLTKGIVTQTDYRSDTMQFEEKLLNKTSKAMEQMLEELNKSKDYFDTKTVEFQDIVNKTEMKTICKIQD